MRNISKEINSCLIELLSDSFIFSKLIRKKVERSSKVA